MTGIRSSSISVRKNQELLIRIWRNLLQRYDRAAMPTLVLAGRPDESAAPLIADLKRANFEDGKIVILANLSDAELSEAYKQCAFTVFPSLCEGWGLPVAESLISGKFCVASNRDSIPEVGSDFIDYFDPSDEADATRKIERAVFDTNYLAERTDRIRRNYVPSSWTDCMKSIMKTIGELRTHPCEPTPDFAHPS
jgi:glycosyltransferase involved in cell wall biosynthesis